MHEYRTLVQRLLDANAWKPADLVRKSGLSRQLVSSILRDDREHLGQMPDQTTLDGLAKGFGIPVERFRIAAARSLVGYVDDGQALTLDLTDVSIDALLGEIRRRVEASFSGEGSLRATVQVVEGESADPGLTNLRPLPAHRDRVARENGWDNEDDLTEDDQAPEPDRQLAARRGESEEKRRRRLEIQPEDESQDDGSDDPL